MSKKKPPKYPGRPVDAVSLTDMQNEIDDLLVKTTNPRCKECGDPMDDDDVMVALETKRWLCYGCSDEYCPWTDIDDEED